MVKRDIVSSTQAGRDGAEIVPAENIRELTLPEIPETSDEAEERGPDEEWVFWSRQISAGLVGERRFRQEALASEMTYFGPDNDVGEGKADEVSKENRIDDKTSYIHSNIDVLKPLIFSETPQPVVRRRYHGDGRADETDLMAAEAGQRLATYLLDTEPFDEAMKGARDDWLIAGRGTARVVYKADFVQEVVDGIVVEKRRNERVCPRHVEWRRFLTAPGHSWYDTPWIAIEVMMTRSKVEKRFPDHAPKFTYDKKGLVDADRAHGDEDRDKGGFSAPTEESGDPGNNPFDTAPVWEIWNRENKSTIWWSGSCKGVVLDKVSDMLGLEEFFPMARPLTATTRGQAMTPRPDIRYYEKRAQEIKKASDKIDSILSALSVSGLIPATLTDELKKLFDGANKIIPVQSWITFMEKGGVANLIQWLPLEPMIQALNALVLMREQSKQTMFEYSGVSDIMRAQGDPNETATAQRMKGNYAGLRLSDRQRTMAIFALDTLRLMVEIALEHFEPDYLFDILGLDIPRTEAERLAEIQRRQQIMALHAQKVQLHQAATMMAQQEQQAGQQPSINPGPPPEEPKFERLPETSWELVHARLKTDLGRKITISIETDSTILADEQADKEARIEFLGAFATFVQQLMPLVGTGQFDLKTIKELLLFGIRGFPKSRTLEGMIASLPDEPQGAPSEDTQVTVAKIKGQIDKEIEAMRSSDKEKDRQHELRLKGVDLMEGLADKAHEDASPKNAPTPAKGK